MGKKRGAGITRTQYAAFRGADFSTDPSLVESCRSPLCTNIVADGGGMPQKRLGWRTVQNLGDTVYGLFGADFGGGRFGLGFFFTVSFDLKRVCNYFVVNDLIVFHFLYLRFQSYHTYL